MYREDKSSSSIKRSRLVVNFKYVIAAPTHVLVGQYFRDTDTLKPFWGPESTNVISGGKCRSTVFLIIFSNTLQLLCINL